MLSRSKFIFITIILASLLSIGSANAAWRDAPAGPPNYDELTPGSGQADYKPMNLGATAQVKQGKIGIFQTPDSNSASFIVNNNFSVPGKIGSSGDAIYVYSNSANAAISAEQANSSGYAIYASGGMNYFSGNVGIGTPAPNATLHVSGGVATIRLTDTSGANSDWSIKQRIRINGDIGFFDNTHSTYPLYISETGNIGIGTTNPQAKLNIKASGNQLRFEDPSGVPGENVFEFKTRYIGPNDLTIFDVFNNAPRLYIDGAGKLGIGTTNPQAKLDVAGDVNITGAYKVNGVDISSGDGVTKTVTGVLGYVPKWTSGSSIGLSDIYNSNGNVGIGTSTPSGLLHLSHLFDGTAETQAILKLETTRTTNNGTSPIIYLKDNYASGYNWALGGGNTGVDFNIIKGAVGAFPSTYAMTILGSNGNVGIGTQSPSYTLDVNGTVSSSQYLTSSDERLKKNIVPLESALDKALLLQGVRYDWRDNIDKSPQIGLIAQDVEKVYPELVRTDSKGYKSVAYDKLTPILLEAIKELNAKVERLESQSR